MFHVAFFGLCRISELTGAPSAHTLLVHGVSFYVDPATLSSTLLSVHHMLSSLPFLASPLVCTSLSTPSNVIYGYALSQLIAFVYVTNWITSSPGHFHLYFEEMFIG
jgi:hypothetical protein